MKSSLGNFYRHLATVYWSHWDSLRCNSCIWNQWTILYMIYVHKLRLSSCTKAIGVKLALHLIYECRMFTGWWVIFLNQMLPILGDFKCGVWQYISGTYTRVTRWWSRQNIGKKPFKKFRKTNYYPFAPLPSLLNALDVNACTTWNKLLHETKFFCVNCSLREPKPEEYLNVAKICSYNNVTISYAAAGLVELQTRRRYDATLEINFTRSIK